MKIAVLGCGLQSIFLTKAIAQKAQTLDIEKLVFFESDERKRAGYGAFCAKICRLLHPRLRFFCTDNLVEAVIAADYVIVLGLPNYEAAADDYLHRIIAQGVFADNSIGVGAFFSAAFVVPILEKYCGYVKKYSRSNVKLINFIPPCGVIMQSLRQQGYDFVYGIGLSARQLLRDIANVLKVDISCLDGRVSGLAGISVFDCIRLDGKEIIPQLLQSDAIFSNTDAKFFDADFLRNVGLVPDRFFSCIVDPTTAIHAQSIAEHTAVQRRIEENSALLHELETEAAVNSLDAAVHALNATLQARVPVGIPFETDDWTVRYFSPFDLDNALFAVETLRFIEALSSDKKEKMFLLAPNAEILPGCSSDDIVLHSCEVSANGIYAKDEHIENTGFLELLRRMKFCERNYVRGIISKDPQAILDGIALFPGVNSFVTAKTLMNKIYERIYNI